MAASAPSPAILAAALGSSRPRWEELIEGLASEYPSLRREWKHYGAKHGWQLKLLSGKRSVLYLIPKQGSFVAAVALNDAAVEALRASRCPAALVHEVLAARRAPEGRPARVDVRAKRDLATVRELVRIKLGS